MNLDHFSGGQSIKIQKKDFLENLKKEKIIKLNFICFMIQFIFHSNVRTVNMSITKCS